MNEPTNPSHDNASVPNQTQPIYPDPDDEPTVTIPYETLEQALDQANARWLADAAAGIASSERTTRRMKALPKTDAT